MVMFTIFDGKVSVPLVRNIVKILRFYTYKKKKTGNLGNSYYTQIIGMRMGPTVKDVLAVYSQPELIEDSVEVATLYRIDSSIIH